MTTIQSSYEVGGKGQSLSLKKKVHTHTVKLLTFPSPSKKNLVLKVLMYS